jgi:hypothetical protein
MGCAGAMPDPTKPPRRFPRPWTVEETQTCFIARDYTGQALAFVYFEEAHRSGVQRQPGD